MTEGHGSPMRTPTLSPNLRGAMWMVASAVCFTVMMMLVKRLTAYAPPLQLFYSQLAVVIALIPTLIRRPAVLGSGQLALVFGRALIAVAGVILSYYSFQTLPLADANALSFTRSLWMAPLGVLLLGERVGPGRAAALVAGFLGVLIVVNPSAGTDIGLPHAAAVGSALLFALTVVSIKLLARDHGTFSLLCWSSILGFLLSIPPAILVWKWPTLEHAALFAVMGGASVGAQTCYIKGMTIGNAVALAPIDYLRLVFAVLVGAVFFNEAPTLSMIAGGTLIVVSTLSITLWESRRPARSSG